MILVMNTTTLDIYNLLVDAGIKPDKAQPLAKEILTRSDATEILATKSDLLTTRADLKSDINRMGFTVIGVVLAGMAVLLQILG